MELCEMIKVMQHYENGGEVEYIVKEDVYPSWSKCVNPLWDWFEFEYRIKKQKVTIEKWLIKDVDSGEHFIIESSDVDLTLKAFPDGCNKLKLIESYEVEL